VSSQPPFIICLMGPTASGKTQLAVELAKRFPIEIISVDSAMVYRGMNIGTAKPDASVLTMAPHRLIDIRDPIEAYSAAHFRKDALHEIEQIIEQGKIPLLVGGTMLYFRALQKGLSDLPAAHPSVRLALTEQADQIGWPGLHERLARVDSTAANRIHPNDSQRIQRALEVYEVTGKTLTDWQQDDAGTSTKYRVVNLVIASNDRVVLHERIQQRFDRMLTQGLIEEVQTFYERGDLSLDDPSMRSVGYRQVWEYLAGHFDKETLRERGIIATRQLAKRQLTWLRSWTDAAWFDSESSDLFEKVSHIF